jgi:site-specific recombinase XerD
MPAPNPWALPVRGYLAHRVAMQDLNPVSLKNAAYILADFARTLSGVDLAVVDQDDVERWISAHQWSAATIRTRLGVVRPFLAWCARKGLSPAALPSTLHGPRMTRPLPRALNRRQIGQLLSGLPDARARAVVLLMAQCGLRVDETARLRVSDWDRADDTLRVLGKGGTERIVWLSAETVEALEQWLVVRGEAKGALISSYQIPGRRLHTTYMGMLVAAWMADSGIDESAHALRHSAATEMLRAGATLAVVQHALGHANLATTSRYLRVYDLDVRKAMTALTYDHLETSRRQGIG